MNLVAIRACAARHQWHEVQFNDQSRVIAFKKDYVRVNVYYTTGTVGTYLNHPTKGKTQLFRRGQDMEGLEAIFEDPRVHTGVGYYTVEELEQRQQRDARRRRGRKW